MDWKKKKDGLEKDIIIYVDIYVLVYLYVCIY